MIREGVMKKCNGMSEHDACMFCTSSQSLVKIENSSDIHGGIHTFCQYTYLVGLHVALLVYLRANSLQPILTRDK